METQAPVDYSPISTYLDSLSDVPLGWASGKVMLFGEYAVLEGASSILTATPHKAHAHYLTLDHLDRVRGLDQDLARLLEQSHKRWSQLKYVIIAFQWGRSLLATTTHGGLECFGQSFELIERCLHAASAPAGIYFIDTQAFGLNIKGQWQKMGIGSSGASSSALCSLLAQLPKVSNRDKLAQPYDRFLFAQQQHRAVQGGLGSGADVACSTFGGLIEFKIENKSLPQVERLRPPLPRTWGLWKGGSFSTSHSLAQLKQWKAENPIPYLQHITQLGLASQRALDLFKDTGSKSVSQDDWCEAVDYAAEMMRHFSERIALPLWTNTHTKWSKLVQKHSGVIKSTGAGGDDLTLFTAQTPSDEIKCIELLRHQCFLDNEHLHIFPLSPLIQEQEYLAFQMP